MATISAKFGPDEIEQLEDICEVLNVDKSEALRRATYQLWLALQIGRPFVERAGGRPRFLLDSGNPDASSSKSRKRDIGAYLQERASKRKKKFKKQGSGDE